MKIQNKRTEKIIEVSDIAWDRMRQMGISRRYRIIAEEPQLRRIEVETEVYEPNREEMIEYLKDKGYRVPNNIGDEKLKEKFNEAN